MAIGCPANRTNGWLVGLTPTNGLFTYLNLGTPRTKRWTNPPCLGNTVRTGDEEGFASPCPWHRAWAIAASWRLPPSEPVKKRVPEDVPLPVLRDPRGSPVIYDGR